MRLLLGITIICFLIFQISAISSNVRYGPRYSISKDHLETVVSPDQPQFKFSFLPAHTFYENIYYTLGYADNNQIPDLLISQLDTAFSSILNTRVIMNLNISDQLHYNGLYYSENSLWTIGLQKDTLSTINKVNRVVFQLSLDGKVLHRYSLPMYEIHDPTNYDHGSQIDQLIYANSSSIILFEWVAYNETRLVRYDYSIPQISLTSPIYLGFHDQIAHVDSDKLWILYRHDPYFEAKHSQDTSVQYPTSDSAGLYALSFNNYQDPFVQSIRIRSLTSIATLILPSTIRNPQITKPILEYSDTLLLVSGENVIRPVYVKQAKNNTINIFYGFEIYSPQSEFLTPLRIYSLGICISSFVGWLILRYQIRPEYEDNIHK